MFSAEDCPQGYSQRPWQIPDNRLLHEQSSRPTDLSLHAWSAYEDRSFCTRCPRSYLLSSGLPAPDITAVLPVHLATRAADFQSQFHPDSHPIWFLFHPVQLQSPDIPVPVHLHTHLLHSLPHRQSPHLLPEPAVLCHPHVPDGYTRCPVWQFQFPEVLQDGRYLHPADMRPSPSRTYSELCADA